MKPGATPWKDFPGYFRLALDNATKNDTIFFMNSKQLRTLKRIFDNPNSVGCDLDGSREPFAGEGGDIQGGARFSIRTSLGQALLSIHKPHPQKELKKYALERVRDFLREVGLTPESAGGNQ